MKVALAVIIAIVAVALLGTWYYALWRGWRHASRDQTPVERRIVVSGVAALALLPVALAVAGASDGAAMIAIAVAMAVVLPALIIVGALDHRRREGRIRNAITAPRTATTETALSTCRQSRCVSE